VQDPEQIPRLENLTNIFASQALERLEPDERGKELTWGYILGELSVEDTLRGHHLRPPR